MGELLDKLERASKGSVQPMGFGGATKREKVAPILLLGAVEAGDNAQTKLALDTGLDGAIVVGRNGAKKADVDKSVKALKGLTVGVWQDEASAKDRAGSDFQVFTSESTPLGSLGGEERTNVMQIVPELDDSLLRTIEHLPVDVFLVSLSDTDTLTVSQLMRLARVRGVTSRWLIAHLAVLPAKEELEQLRNAGIGAIVVDLAGREAEALRACKQAMLELPHESPERHKGRNVATLPSLMRPAGPPAHQPEPEPDDGDWEDE